LSWTSWTSDGVAGTARDDVVGAVRTAIREAGTLYAWAARQEPRTVFHGRGEAYGVALGPMAAVVRHARRGGRLAPLLGDRYLGAPRFEREIANAEALRAAGVATPAVLAGVRYAAGIFHRTDVATERLMGRDLAATFFDQAAPEGETRAAVLTAAGALVRRLHEAGWVHPDLQLRNVLAGPGADGGIGAWLLDVDTCRRARRPGDPAANLARFDRSWRKWNARRGERLTSADRDTFLRAYGASA